MNSQEHWPSEGGILMGIRVGRFLTAHETDLCSESESATLSGALVNG